MTLSVKKLLFLSMLVAAREVEATTCTLSGSYNNTTQFQTAINTCGANDTVVLTGTAQWSGVITVGVNRTLRISNSATINGAGSIIAAKPILVSTGATFNTNGLAVVVGGITLTGLGTITGPAVVLSTGVVLPVTLADWYGKPNNDGTVSLYWSTATEINNRGFEIERSIDGVEFEKIGWIDGNGDSRELLHYSFTDDKVYSKLYYYRLRQRDYDENFEYSKIIPVSFEQMEFKVDVYPTVASDELKIKSSEMVKYRIVNMEGEVCQSGLVGAVQDIVKVQNLSNGRYFIQFLFGSNTPKSFTFFKFL